MLMTPLTFQQQLRHKAVRIFDVARGLVASRDAHCLVGCCFALGDAEDGCVLMATYKPCPCQLDQTRTLRPETNARGGSWLSFMRGGGPYLCICNHVCLTPLIILCQPSARRRLPPSPMI